MTKPVRVVIADDHPVFRAGLRQVLAADPGIEVVGEAADGASAVELVRSERPDVAVLDVDMPGTDGFAAVRALREAGLEVAVVILTMHKDEAVFNKALDLGVAGFLLKDSAVAEVPSSVRAVAAGGAYVSPAVSSFLLARGRRAARLEAERPGLEALTPSERRVLRGVAADKTSREIAAELFVSVRTVENHRANICAKLGLKGSNALLRFALEHRSELLS